MYFVKADTTFTFHVFRHVVGDEIQSGKILEGENVVTSLGEDEGMSRPSIQVKLTIDSSIQFLTWYFSYCDKIWNNCDRFFLWRRGRRRHCRHPRQQRSHTSYRWSHLDLNPMSNYMK